MALRRGSIHKVVQKVKLLNAAGGHLGEPKESNEGVTVTVRLRPFIKEEAARGSETKLCVAMPNKQIVEISSSPQYGKFQPFTFDRVYWSHDPSHELYATQATLYEELGVTMIGHALTGYNACIFAYGQTGSGKSYSVLGTDTEEGRGLLPRIVQGLFEKFEEDPKKTSSCMVSFMEIYNEQIRDLLSPAGAPQIELKVRQHPVLGTSVDGLTESSVRSKAEVMQMIDTGTARRTVGATAMNFGSSRSHCIFTFKTSVTGTLGDAKMSQTHLVDLAGSERANRTGAQGDRLAEGAAINKSLSNLSRVISALAENAGKPAKKASMPPFRDSKLTYVLKESLCGNSKTYMMAAIAPSVADYEETLSTLRFAQSVKKVQLSACANEVNTKNEKAIEKQLREEILQLKKDMTKQKCVSAIQVARLKDKAHQWKQQYELCTTAGIQHIATDGTQSGGLANFVLQTKGGVSASHSEKAISNFVTECFGDSESDTDDESSPNAEGLDSVLEKTLMELKENLEQQRSRLESAATAGELTKDALDTEISQLRELVDTQQTLLESQQQSIRGGRAATASADTAAWLQMRGVRGARSNHSALAIGSSSSLADAPDISRTSGLQTQDSPPSAEIQRPKCFDQATQMEPMETACIEDGNPSGLVPGTCDSTGGTEAAINVLGNAPGIRISPTPNSQSSVANTSADMWRTHLKRLEALCVRIETDRNDNVARMTIRPHSDYSSSELERLGRVVAQQSQQLGMASTEIARIYASVDENAQDFLVGMKACENEEQHFEERLESPTPRAENGIGEELDRLGRLVAWQSQQLALASNEIKRLDRVKDNHSDQEHVDGADVSERSPRKRFAEIVNLKATQREASLRETDLAEQLAAAKAEVELLRATLEEERQKHSFSFNSAMNAIFCGRAQEKPTSSSSTARGIELDGARTTKKERRKSQLESCP